MKELNEGLLVNKYIDRAGKKTWNGAIKKINSNNDQIKNRSSNKFEYGYKNNGFKSLRI